MARIGRRIAFDHGDVRIGVAICDPDGILATPIATLQSKSPTLKSEITKLLSGDNGEAVAKVAKFIEFLTANFDLPITLVDERLSTITAAKQLRESGVNAKEAKSQIDAAAAVAILEQGLANEVK
jgi:putative Holliday junction resolvase